MQQSKIGGSRSNSSREDCIINDHCEFRGERDKYEEEQEKTTTVAATTAYERGDQQ